jgi:hypothetical protein
MSLIKLSKTQKILNKIPKIRFLIVNSKINLKDPYYYSFLEEKLRKIEKAIINSAIV